MKQSWGIDWRVVRGLGQLQLLNRASMFMVVFVPILAASWPTLQRAVSWVTSSQSQLPSSWAVLFFAALSTLLARTFFQLRCPDVVKDFSLTEYVQRKKRKYSDAPSLSAITEAIDQLTAAKSGEHLVDQELQREEAIEIEKEAIKERIRFLEHQIVNQPPESNERDYNYKRDALANELRDYRNQLMRVEERDRGDRGPDFRRKMALIETAGRLFYLEQARTNVLALLGCALGYILGIGLILYVIAKQSAAVAEAAGWLVP